MGDFNAKIGKKGKDENNNWIGNHGIGVRIERGERLLDFAAENRLFITNTLFEKQTSRYTGHGNHQVESTKIKLTLF